MKKTLVAIAAASFTALAFFAPAAAQTAKTNAMAADCKAVLKSKIMLNTAKLEELMCLPGMSKAVAADLVKERPFKDEKDFLNRIEGGRKLWTGISPYVTLK